MVILRFWCCVTRVRAPAFGTNRPGPLSVSASIGGLFQFQPSVQCRLLALSGQSSRTRVCPLLDASSTGRCNTGVKSLCWAFELQGLTWPFVELTRHFVQMGLRVHRQVGSLRKVLSQQTIGVLV